MSLTAPVPVICSGCQCLAEYSACQYLDAAESPDLKARLLAEELFLYGCPACDAETPVVHPLLYHDPALHVLLRLLPPQFTGVPLHVAAYTSPADPARLYRRRLVETPEELLEKILLFQDGYDDRVVEAYKLTLLRTWQTPPAPLQLAAGEGGLVGPSFPALAPASACAAAGGEAAAPGCLYYIATEGDRITFSLQTPLGRHSFAVSRSRQYTPFAEALAGRLPAVEDESDLWLQVNGAYVLRLEV